MPIRAVICDFGGVLTSPLAHAFNAFEHHMGIAPAQLGEAMRAGAADLDGANPLFELECGRISEQRFLEVLGGRLTPMLGREPELGGFSRRFFEALDPNEPMIELMASLRDRGQQMAMLTNNVREWEPLWRPFLPVDEIFETVVDSGFVGMRKPEPEIYQLTVSRLEGIEANQCLFVDDMDINCMAARELGMGAVHFEHNEQAIADIESALTWDGRNE